MKKVWIVFDQRKTKDEIIQGVLSGGHSYYEYADAAERDKFPTEKIWEIQIQATEVV